MIRLRHPMATGRPATVWIRANRAMPLPTANRIARRSFSEAYRQTPRYMSKAENAMDMMTTYTIAVGTRLAHSGAGHAVPAVPAVSTSVIGRHRLAISTSWANTTAGRCHRVRNRTRKARS